MDRRTFLQAAGTSSVASLPAWATANSSPVPGDPPSGDTVRVWHFFDLWRFDHCDGLRLQQGAPTWRREATFAESHVGPLSAWPTVFQDRQSGGWRMLYSANWKPYMLMLAESEDGIHWRPSPRPEIAPAGRKIAPHHLFTLPGGSGGGVYLDALASDGFPFKVFVHQRGEEVVARALANPQHRWHEIAKAEGAKRYLADEFTVVSRDGLSWQPRLDMNWSTPDWHPEPPIFGFYNRHSRRHQMTVRPGWGDRRLCLQGTADFRDWSGPGQLLQPDALDEELIEMYGMPVFSYGDAYVGLLWVFHCESSEPTRGFNRFVGPLDCELAFSYDGLRFARGLRRPFIACNQPGEHGGGAIEPSCLVETDNELRIYSSATKMHHGQSSAARRDGVTDNASITLHTLRKDGLMFLQSTGNWGRFISKPLVLLDEQLTLNVAAAHGELTCQLTDLESRPVRGFTFEDFQSLRSADELSFRARWKTPLSEVLGRIVRLEVRTRHAELFAIRGNVHFIDAQDKWMIEDGKQIAT